MGRYDEKLLNHRVLHIKIKALQDTNARLTILAEWTPKTVIAEKGCWCRYRVPRNSKLGSKPRNYENLVGAHESTHRNRTD